MVIRSHLIFLHGALGCNNHWERFLPYFTDKFEVHNLNFPSHGNSKIKTKDHSYSSLSAFVSSYISKNNIQDFSIIGYSMGGYIGLNLILQKITGFNSLITLATKLNWNVAIAEQECVKLSIDNLTPILEKLKKEHAIDPEGLIEITKGILNSIGRDPINKDQFISNKIPVTMLLGSNDRMVTKEEIMAFSENLPFVNFKILKDQPHNLEKIDANLIAQTCLQLLAIGESNR